MNSKIKEFLKDSKNPLYCNLNRDGDICLVTVSVPGVAKGDVDVRVFKDGGSYLLAGKVVKVSGKDSGVEEGDVFAVNINNEKYDVEKISAVQENGLLVISIPEISEPEIKIEVKGGGKQ